MGRRARWMRIIAGEARGTRLDVAGGSPTRPFLEMARGALFNSLAARVAGARALDLYAGSGALGLEALSRGARSAVFVERDRAALAALRDNIRRCGYQAEARVVAGDAMAVPETLAGEFDLVFVDPPFPGPPAWAENGDDVRLGGALAGILAPDGIVVLRLEGKTARPPAWDGLVPGRGRRYGRSGIYMYARSAGESR